MASRSCISHISSRRRGNAIGISSSSCKRQSSRWQCSNIAVALIMLASAMTMLPRSFAFSSISMSAYKPPVKSSVSKIRNSRITDLRTANAHQSRSTSKSAYAGALHGPSTLVPRPQSFEKRMRQLVLGTAAATRPRPKPTATATTYASASPAVSTKPANIMTVETLADYKKVVADEKERIVAVRFHSPWCRACKAMAPAFYHLAIQHPDILFVDVPTTADNANLHQGLGVPSLPFGHIYLPDQGLVEELRMTKSQMPEFQEKLEGHLLQQQQQSSTIGLDSPRP